MDYEKKYKEALERARAYFENENYTEMADVFPEIKESEDEDERIRKEIIHYILYDAKGVSEEQEHAWIAYLEKQKERKPADWRDRLKDEIKHLKIDVYDEAHQFDLGARSSLTFLESFIDSLTQETPDKETILRVCKLHKAWSIIAPWKNIEDFVMTNWNSENIV